MPLASPPIAVAELRRVLARAEPHGNAGLWCMFEDKRNDVFAGNIGKWLGIESCRLIVYLFCHDVFCFLATWPMRRD
jgi:hypothetical protein